MVYKGVETINRLGRESFIPRQCCSLKGRGKDPTYDHIVISIEVSLGEVRI